MTVERLDTLATGTPERLAVGTPESLVTGALK